MFWNEMYFVEKSCYNIFLSKTYVILDHLICISENVKKETNFGGVRKKTVFATFPNGIGSSKRK